MDTAVTAPKKDDVALTGWIRCSEKLPPASQFVLYRTPEYVALGKLESQTWYFSGEDIEPEERPVLCWQPLN